MFRELVVGSENKTSGAVLTEASDLVFLEHAERALTGRCG